MAGIESEGNGGALSSAFAAHALDIGRDEDDYARLLSIGDERQRIATDLRRRGFGAAADETADDVIHTKDALFADCVLDGDVAARSGLIDAVMNCFVPGVWVAVVSTARRAGGQTPVGRLVGA